MITICKEPFKNDIGQIIEPGEPVVFIASGYAHSAKIGTGVFVGIKKAKKINYVYDPVTRLTELKETDPVSIAAIVKDIPSQRYNYSKHQYEDYVRKTNLWLMRVYKIDTTLKDIKSFQV